MENGKWKAVVAAASLALTAYAAERAVEGPWRVDFPHDRDLPASVTMRKLVPWKDAFDDSRKGNSACNRHYSGSATYHASFVWREKAPGKVILDLGRVERKVRVEVNGHDMGTCDKAPYRVEIARALKPGINELALTVTSSPHNRLVFDASMPPGDRRVRTEVWPDPSAPLEDSGLLGPVRLLWDGVSAL